MDYADFILAKVSLEYATRPPLPAGAVNPLLKPHQADAVRWMVAGGRRAVFAAFGLGKTFMQIEAMRLTLAETGGRGLIVAPLGVRREFIKDAEALATGAHPAVNDAQREALAAWIGEDAARAPSIRFIRSVNEAAATGLYITNYETVRDGKINPADFAASSLDEAACLRGFGSTKTFREFMRLFEALPRKFVATATPSPNDYIELLAYAAYLGIMDVGEAKTRFFKRDSTKADNLTLHPHKEEEFWLWVSSWALFIQRPSDLGHDDAGYDLPPLNVHWHEVESEARPLAVKGDGQVVLFGAGGMGLSEAAAEKRASLSYRIEHAQRIKEAEPARRMIFWHDLEDERRALEKAMPGIASVHGAQSLEDREAIITAFADGEGPDLAAKPVMLGSGCNLQRHCSAAVYLGLGFKFNDFIQSIHRIYRFLQGEAVDIHLIHSVNERPVVDILKKKWRQDQELRARMSGIIKQYGLSAEAMAQALQRGDGVERIEVSGDNYRCILNDCVEEARALPDNSIDLIVSSIPFSTQYEYTPNLRDFGHTDDNAHFFAQMDYLTPSLLKALKPGRIAAIHVKDRITPGGVNGLGFQTVQPFHMETAAHFMGHGFAYMGMVTIATDVVRENNQTYRLSFSEKVKDGTKMSVGLPEYVLLFRKPPTSSEKSYADEPVAKRKKWFEDLRSDGERQARNADGSDVVAAYGREWLNPDGYSLARWQLDAAGLWRSSGDRFIRPEDLTSLPADLVYKRWKAWSLDEVYDYEHHVMIGEALSLHGRLPTTFSLIPAHVAGRADIWTDVARMRTLNMSQAQKGLQQHLCPLQFDIVARLIESYSAKGETVLDPFGGLMTVPYMAVKMGRSGIGFELNAGYFADGVKHCEAAQRGRSMPSLFDMMGFEAEAKAGALEAAE
jgi:hypothetical protein